MLRLSWGGTNPGVSSTITFGQEFCKRVINLHEFVEEAVQRVGGVCGRGTVGHASFHGEPGYVALHH